MKKMMAFLCALTLLCAASKVSANDFGVYGVGGSWRPFKGEHRSIRMVRETVRLDIYDIQNARYYDVNATFVFHNQGAATSVDMAFPERSGGADAMNAKSLTGFTSFRTTIAGKSAKANRVLSKRRLASGVEYQALWIKRVSFKKGETKLVSVKYRSDAGNLAGTGFFASYDFSGENWFGTVKESTLTVVFHSSESQPSAGFFRNKRLAMKRDGSTFTYKWANWQANGPFKFWFALAEDLPHTDEDFKIN